MATPIGHGLVGYAVFLFLKKWKRGLPVPLLFLAVFFAIVPDLDFLPGLFMGQPALYHQGISHSLSFAFVSGIVCGLFVRGQNRSFFPVFLLIFVACTSHLVLDFFGPDGRTPYGIPLLWPFSSTHFLSPIQLLPGVHHVRTTDAPTGEWLLGVLHWDNLIRIGKEILVIAPLVLLAVWCNRPRQPLNSKKVSPSTSQDKESSLKTKSRLSHE